MESSDDPRLSHKRFVSRLVGMNSFSTSTAPFRPGAEGLREALGPGFAMVAPTEATLLTATGHRPVRVGHRPRA